jgi:hypothetical protein
VHRLPIGFRVAEPERRLIAGEVATVVFPLTRSPSFSRGSSVQLEVERELYLEIKELS